MSTSHGGRASAAAIYPEGLCRATVEGVIAQKKVDSSSRVGMGKMGKIQVSSLCRGLVAEVRRDEIATASGACSSVIRDGDRCRPAGKYPSDWVDFMHEEYGGNHAHAASPQYGINVLEREMYGLVCSNSF